MDSEKALRLLRDRLRDVQELARVHAPAFDTWRAKTEVDLGNTFPEGDHVNPFRTVWFPRHTTGPLGTSQAVLKQDFESQASESIGLLEGAIHEVTVYWAPSQRERAVNVPRAATRSERVFVVHGHDLATRAEVVEALETLGLDAVLLSAKANEARSVMEKLEHETDVGYAVVPYSPDDQVVGEAEDAVWRARKSVVLEQGYFIGTLVRDEVTILGRSPEALDIPSDDLGAMYVDFDAGGAWRLKLALELKAAELPIDIDCLLCGT